MKLIKRNFYNYENEKYEGIQRITAVCLPDVKLTLNTGKLISQITTQKPKDSIKVIKLNQAR